MEELLNAFLRSVSNDNVRMSEQDIKTFLKYFPDKTLITPEVLQIIREASRARFGHQVVGVVDTQMDFSADGDFAYLIPKTGFIRLYLEYTKQLEAPIEFQFFCSIAVMAQAVGRRVYVARGNHCIYPPTPLILVAPSGICRKSSAVQLAVKLAREVEIPVLANKITPEDFIRQLQASHRGASPLISAPELSVLIGRQKYNMGLIEILTDLLDCPDHWESGTIMRGRTELKNVTLGLIGASTPNWLKSSVPIEAFAGGFMSRLLLVVKTDTPRDIPSPPQLDTDLWEGLKQFLINLIAQDPVAMPLTKEATEWYHTWYMAHRKQVRNAGDDKVGYYARKSDHLIRLAMNLQISRGMFTLTPIALEEADAIFHWLEENTPAVIKLLLANEHGQVATTIIQLLRKEGGHVPRIQILRDAIKHFSPRLVQEAIATLHATEQIGRYESRTGEDVLFLKDWSDQ